MESGPSQCIRLRTRRRTFLALSGCLRIYLIGRFAAKLLNYISASKAISIPLRFPMEAVMTEEENRQENWSRLLKWLAVIAVIALLVFTSFFLKVPHVGIE
jgi:hypothetical protein